MMIEPHERELLSELDGSLLDSVQRIRNTSPPAESMQTTLARFNELLSADLTSNEIEPTSLAKTSHTIRFSANWAGGLTAAVISVVMASIWLSSPSVGLAQIAQALATQDWVQVTETADGVTRELWYSRTKDISASRDNESIEFRDHKTGVFHAYQRHENTLYRALEGDMPQRHDLYSELASSLPLLLEGFPHSDLLTHVKILDGHRERLKVIHQTLSRVDDLKHDLLDYNVMVEFDGQPAKLSFRIESESMLPQYCRMTTTYDDNELELVLQFSYPTQGPQDVFSLGVPEDAIYIDRIPPENVQVLLASMKAASHRFDNYRAIMVNYVEGDPFWWINANVEVVHRKENQWRRSSIVRSFQLEGPTKDTDMKLWWAQQVKESPVPDGHLMTIRQDDIEWRYSGDSKRRFIISVPSFWSMTPEWIMRPPTGFANNLHFEVNSTESSKEGPAGTMLLEVTPTIDANVAYGLTNATFSPTARYWIDVEKLLVMQWDEIDADGQVMSSTIVEQTAKSPDGYWYPVRLLRKAVMPNGETVESNMAIYLDFDSELPDQLFKPI